jgi:hypothetical protein
MIDNPENESAYCQNRTIHAQCISMNKDGYTVMCVQQGKEMGNHLNNIIFGMINQPQVWIKQENDINNFLNYRCFGIISQPQIRIEKIGEKK